jgi:hypothetical protein
MSEDVSTNPYEAELDLGWVAFGREDFDAARQHFEKAHQLGHDNVARHLAVHYALLKVARKDGAVRRVISELYSVVMLNLLRPLLQR